MALGRQPGAQLPAVTSRDAKSICRPTVPAFLVSRRNLTPANGARPRSDPDAGMNTLTAQSTGPSGGPPRWREPPAQGGVAAGPGDEGRISRHRRHGAPDATPGPG